MTEYQRGQMDLALKIYNIIINEDDTFRFIRYHTDKERAQYCSNMLMKIYTTIKSIIRDRLADETASE